MNSQIRLQRLVYSQKIVRGSNSCFSSKDNDKTYRIKTNEDLLRDRVEYTDEQLRFIEEEKKAFAQLPENQQAQLRSQKELALKQMEEDRDAPQRWWNRVNEMTIDDLETIPERLVSRLSSNLIKMMDHRAMENEQISKEYPFYQQVKDLDKLKTFKQVDYELDIKERMISGDEEIDKYEKKDFMKRQPRADISTYNYNYEQFREYTSYFYSAKKKDEERQRKFYSLIRYLKENEGKGVNRVEQIKHRYRLDLIEIPEEFKDVPTDLVTPPKRKKRKPISPLFNHDLKYYDCWRVHDRQLYKSGSESFCNRIMYLVPSLLVKAFGLPGESRTGYNGTGEYDFEDLHFDLYNLCDYKQTDHYWGLNREDEYYESQKNIRHKLHKREKKWPTIQEFWESTDPKPFQLRWTHNADSKKFKRWLRKTVEAAADREVPFDDELTEKFKNEVDICLGDYDKKGTVNQDMAVYRWDHSYFMTKDQLAKYKGETLEKLVLPKSFDFSKAERVYFTLEDLKKLEEEEELAKQKDI